MANRGVGFVVYAESVREYVIIQQNTTTKFNCGVIPRPSVVSQGMAGIENAAYLLCTR